MDLCYRERKVKQRCGHFEGNLPPIPETSEEPHRHNRLTSGACCGRYAGKKEDPLEEVVTVRKDAIEDYGHVWEEFGHYIESTYRDMLVFDCILK